MVQKNKEKGTVESQRTGFPDKVGGVKNINLEKTRENKEISGGKNMGGAGPMSPRERGT